MGSMIGCTYFLGLGPLVLGQQLVGDTALDGAAQSVDTVIGFLGSEAPQGLQNVLVLLDNQIVGSVSMAKKKPLVSIVSIVLVAAPR